MNFSNIARWFAGLTILAGLFGLAMGFWIDIDPSRAAETFGPDVNGGGELLKESFFFIFFGFGLGVLSEISFALRRLSRTEKEEK